MHPAFSIVFFTTLAGLAQGLVVVLALATLAGFPVSAGYADGLPRALSGKGLVLWAGGRSAPVVGRVSMDLITVDVSDLPDVPDRLEILNARQGIEDLARLAGTIGYEILTSLGSRYPRDYRPV